MENLIQYGGSVAIYAACFLLSVVMAGLSQVYDRVARPLTCAPGLTQHRRPNRAWWVFSMIVLVVLSSLRFETGTDYPSYRLLFTSINEIGSLEMFLGQMSIVEPAFILLNFLVKAVFNQYQFMFVLSALITMAFCYRAMADYHEKCSVMLAVLVFVTLFFSSSLNIVRQMMAVAIVFYATRYIFLRKYRTAGLLAILAAMFHVTALIVIPVWLVAGARPWQQTARRLMYIALPALLFGLTLFRAVFSQIPLGGLLVENTEAGSTLGIGLLLLRAPIVVPLLLSRKQLIAHDGRNRLWIVFVVFEVILSYFGYLNPVLNRLSLYFASAWIVLLPSLVRSMPTRELQRWAGAYVVLVVAALWFYNIVVNNYGDVLPYTTIFQARAALG